MEQKFDLLGDPIPENWGKRGRPPHIPTQENRNKVRLLLAFGWTDRRVAAALRITKATLRKHYFVELRHRDEAREALKASHLSMVYDAATKGNVGAMRQLGQLIQRDELDPTRLPAGAKPAAERPEKLGKKEAAEQAAQTAHEGTTWSSLLKH